MATSLFFPNDSKYRNRANSAVLNREIKSDGGGGWEERTHSLCRWYRLQLSTLQCRAFAYKKELGNSTHRKTAGPTTLLLRGNRDR